MKRDFDLIRELLLDIEENIGPVNEGYEPNVEGYSEELIYGHLILLAEAGFITGANIEIHGGGVYIAHSMTYSGFDFLDKIRDTTMWAKIKAFVKSKGAPLVVDTIKMASVEIIKNLI